MSFDLNSRYIIMTWICKLRKKKKQIVNTAPAFYID